MEGKLKVDSRRTDSDDEGNTFGLWIAKEFVFRHKIQISTNRTSTNLTDTWTSICLEGFSMMMKIKRFLITYKEKIIDMKSLGWWNLWNDRLQNGWEAENLSRKERTRNASKISRRAAENPRAIFRFETTTERGKDFCRCFRTTKIDVTNTVLLIIIYNTFNCTGAVPIFPNFGEVHLIGTLFFQRQGMFCSKNPNKMNFF